MPFVYMRYVYTRNMTVYLSSSLFNSWSVTGVTFLLEKSVTFDGAQLHSQLSRMV